MKFFKELEKIINCYDIHKKIEKFNKLKDSEWEFEDNEEIKVFEKASYENFCELINPRIAPKRRGFDTDLKRATLIHAIVHIEYSAIDLALDACYRYRNMPLEFYKDWFEVADDEIRHFQMLNELLEETGYKYGDLPVHNSLWEAGLKSLPLLNRMAIIPRWQEANGLDSNEKIIRRLESYGTDLSKRLIKVLNIILDEEIPHVKKGDKWFKYECDRLGYDYGIYFDILYKTFEGVKLKPYLNVEARKKAGFSCDELKKLSAKELKC